MNAIVESRLVLAQRLRELADSSDEAQLRNALSRSYYSIYHAANALLGKVGHHNIAEELGKIDQELGSSVQVLQRLRMQADYDPQMIEREFNGDIESFRSEVRKQLDLGLLVYRRTIRELEQRGAAEQG